MSNVLLFLLGDLCTYTLACEDALWASITPQATQANNKYQDVNICIPQEHFTNKNVNLYSITIAIVSWLDLNSLDNLSRTCRQIRTNLLQYRGPLVTHTMHCYKEQPPLEPDDNEMNWHYMSISDGHGRKGRCARDLVAESRRSARPVCRVSESIFITPLPPGYFQARGNSKTKGANWQEYRGLTS